MVNKPRAQEFLLEQAIHNIVKEIIKAKLFSLNKNKDPFTGKEINQIRMVVFGVPDFIRDQDGKLIPVGIET